jgi:hypothetical protein
MIQRSSIDSYYEVKRKNMSEDQLRVFNALRNWGPMTDQELRVNVGELDPNAVRPRRNELANPKKWFPDPPKVVPVGKRKCKVTGKTVIVWGVNLMRTKQGSLFEVKNCSGTILYEPAHNIQNNTV